MRDLLLLSTWLSLLALTSCKDTARQTDTYFDSLVVAQVRYLSSAKPALTKRATMNGTVDQSTFHPDSALWKTELDIFRKLSLFERPTYRDAYRLEDGLNDKTSNLLVRHYAANREVPVPELKFYYYKKLKNLKKIEATYQQSNALYSTTRNLILEFEEIQGVPVLSAYQIKGVEKMIMTDTVRFSVQSRLSY